MGLTDEAGALVDRATFVVGLGGMALVQLESGNGDLPEVRLNTRGQQLDKFQLPPTISAADSASTARRWASISTVKVVQALA